MNTQESTKISTPFIQFSLLCFKLFVILIICLSLTACIFSKNIAPTSDLSRKDAAKVANTSEHRVKRGETLFAIAWKYGLDYRQLAAVNGIDDRFLIYPGQVLNLSIKPATSTASTASHNNKKAPVATSSSVSSASPPQSEKKNVSRKPVKSSAMPTPPVVRAEKKSPTSNKISVSNSSSQKLIWRWPARGRVITHFSSAKAENKGIDLAGKKGDSVTAAASGTIVYAGSGLRGYGKLIIIKHNDTYLSAYAHNNRIRVREGQKVNAGQHIADIGSSGSRANITKLHFEIRRNGQSVNPLKYLPKRKT